MNSKSNYDSVKGVACNVEGCTYNHEGRDCRAEHIQVRNDQAQTKSETFCSTFEQKSKWL